MVVPISMRTRTAAELTEEEEEGRGGESLLGAGLVTKQASPLELGRPTPTKRKEEEDEFIQNRTRVRLVSQRVLLAMAPCSLANGSIPSQWSAIADMIPGQSCQYQLHHSSEARGNSYSHLRGRNSSSA